MTPPPSLMPSRVKIENCDTSEVLKIKNTAKLQKKKKKLIIMYEKLYGIEAGRASTPVQSEIPIRFLLNF